MKDISYLVVHYLTGREPKIKEPALNVRIWKPGNDPDNIHSLDDAIWTGKPDESEDGTAFKEFPISQVIVNGHLLMGMTTGEIVKIDLSTGQEVKRYGPRMAGKEPVRAEVLAKLGKTAYDGGKAGLFKTFSGKQVYKGRIEKGNVEVIDGRLCIVPYDCKQDGHLVDAMTGEVIMPDVERVLDTSGGEKRGQHITIGDRVYIAEGYYPNISMIIRNLSTGKTESEYNVATLGNLIGHNGEAHYVITTGDNQAIVRVGEDGLDKGRNSFELPEDEVAFSTVSGGNLGLLVAFHNRDFSNPRTRIACLQLPDKIQTVLEALGRYDLRPLE